MLVLSLGHSLETPGRVAGWGGWVAGGNPYILAVPQDNCITPKWENLVPIFLSISRSFQYASKIGNHYANLVILTLLHIRIIYASLKTFLKMLRNREEASFLTWWFTLVKLVSD